MNITTFRYITKHDPCEYALWGNWSRCYEYPMTFRALDRLAERKGRKITVHNTACGGSQLHTLFATMLYGRYDVVNSDITPMQLADNPKWPWMPNYRVYNLLTPTDLRFDAVLCISTVEHLSQSEVLHALRNLYQQVASGGMLLVTADVPPAEIARLETFAGCTCSPQGDTDVMDSAKRRVVYLEATRE